MTGPEVALLFTVCMVASFWLGWYFGDNQDRRHRK